MVRGYHHILGTMVLYLQRPRATVGDGLNHDLLPILLIRLAAIRTQLPAAAGRRRRAGLKAYKSNQSS